MNFDIIDYSMILRNKIISNRIFFPNTFNPITTIEYGLVHPGNVRIIVYDVLGNIMKNLENSNKKAGNYRVNWNGLNKNNQPEVFPKRK